MRAAYEIDPKNFEKGTQREGKAHKPDDNTNERQRAEDRFRQDNTHSGNSESGKQ